MLKLITDEVPSWAIDWTNKTFTLASYIWYITLVIIDGTIVTGETFLHDTITVLNAPNTSITVSYFSREERQILGNWEVTMWMLIQDLYDEIGRSNVSKIYTKPRLRKEFNKTIWMMNDEAPEQSRLQHFSFQWINWLKVAVNWHTVNLTTKQTYWMPIQWSLMVWFGIYYNYFGYDGQSFTLSGADMIKSYDRIIVWTRIPYWINKIAEVYVNSVKLKYVDNREFYMDTVDHFTIIKDYEWNSYLYLPYNSKLYTCVVKFVPDYTLTTLDEDIIDIPYKYTRAFIYDIAYRILASREDDRWQYYKKQALEETKKYKRYMWKWTAKTKWTIWLANVFEEREARRMSDFLPSWVYDPYIWI